MTKAYLELDNHTKKNGYSPAALLELDIDSAVEGKGIEYNSICEKLLLILI